MSPGAAGTVAMAAMAAMAAGWGSAPRRTRVEGPSVVSLFARWSISAANYTQADHSPGGAALSRGGAQHLPCAGCIFCPPSSPRCR